MVSKLRIVLIFIALAVASVAIISVYLFSAISALSSSVVSGPTGSINASLSIHTESVLQYNNSQYLAGYALLNYDTKNVSQMNLSLRMYGSAPVEPVYFISTKVGIFDYCVRCFGQASLGAELMGSLADHGLIFNSSSFNYVNLENISLIPPHSIVVLQSGLIPTWLLPYSAYSGADIVSGNATLLTLLDRGDTVIYVGRNFSTSIGNGGNIYLTTNRTIEALGNASIVAEPFMPGLQGNKTGRLFFRYPTFGFVDGQEYGNASAVNSRNGTLIALSNYPLSGWDNSSALASDIANIIDSRFWIAELAYGVSNFTLANGSVGNAYAVTDLQYLNGSAASQVNGSYSLLTARLSNLDRQKVYQMPFRARLTNIGRINMAGTVGEGESLPINVYSGNVLYAPTAFHLDIANLNGTTFGSLPLGFYNRSFNIVHYYTFTVPSGYYTASLVSINGSRYAGALFYVSNVSISASSLDFKNRTFAFTLESDRLPLSNISYTISLNGAYPQNGVVQNGAVLYTLPGGAAEGYGTKVFDFRMLGSNYQYTFNYASPTSGIPPLYIEFGIVAVFIIVLNLVLKAPASDDYYIDVPDFPPLNRIKLKTDSNSIIGIFSSINFSHHWKYMPLTAEEVKNGVSSNIRYESIPVAATLQNVTGVLNKMVAKGLLLSSGEYYAPARWVTESGHSMEYLTIFRNLRDFCVANAMLFTDLDADPHVDMIVTRKGSQGYIIINAASEMKDIAINNAYRIYIVFLDEIGRLAFLTKLYDSYGEQAELLRIGVEHSYIVLTDTDNLEQLLS
jgi:hypothetical protein